MDLPEPLTPVTHVNAFSGMRDVDALEVVLGRARELDLLTAAAAPGAGHRNRQLAAQVLRRQRARLLHESVERAGEDDAAALFASAEPKVDNVIGDLDHVGVVLDHEHGVALIPKLTKDGDQPKVVARVQADGRLVEDIQRADQRRARARSPD